jgi:hypothetical protein
MLLRSQSTSTPKRPRFDGEEGFPGKDDDPSPPRKRQRSYKDRRAAAMPSEEAIASIVNQPASQAIAIFSEGSSGPGPITAPVVEPTAPLTPAELSSCPDWFLKAYQMLLSKDLGPAWMELIRAWAHFEKELDYSEEAKLGTKGRPPCVAAWIARARTSTYRPDLGPLAAFEKSFRTWWKSLQPEWRRNGPSANLSRDMGNLDDLRRPGKNGLLSVLAALFFWAANAEKVGRIDWEQPWGQAVDDVAWVIQRLRLAALA